MTYDKACTILGFTTPKSMARNAQLAQSRLGNMAPNAPLKYKVACMVLMRAAG